MVVGSCMIKCIKSTFTFARSYGSANKHGFKTIMSSQAYFRWQTDSPTFLFTFFLSSDEPKVSRNFNFERRIKETIGEFENRICANVEKTVKKKKKKKSGPPDEEPPLQVDFTLSGSPVDKDFNCKDTLLAGGVVLNLLGQRLEVAVNVPWVTSIALPDSILAGFPVYPLKLELDFASQECCQFTWLKQQGADWVEVGTGPVYTPPVEDVSCSLKLRCEPRNRECRVGPAVEAVAPNAVAAGPGPSPFDTRHAFTAEYLHGNSFRVVCYNILADLYADSDFSRTELFPYCPPYAIAINYRKQLILKELTGYHADIICLQEVDSKVFDLDLTPVLRALGYEGCFSRKGGQVTEGLACLFRKDRFELLENVAMNLGEEISTNPLFERVFNALKNNEALRTRVLERGSIVQVTVLRNKENKKILVVGSTHLYFHPDADHIRLLQAATALDLLQDVAKKWETKCDLIDDISILFCGDFNSTPEFGVYKLMTEKHIPEDYPDWVNKLEEAVIGLSLSHELHLESACGTPKYTNFTVGFADCLDYIFYQKDKMKVCQVVPLPSEEELRQHTALPSVVLPSDHVALVTDLSWL